MTEPSSIPRPDRFERGAVAALLVLGAALRLWNLDGWPGFSGDEGRDVFYARQIAETGTFALHPVRPYFGPWQLWLMAPFFKVAGVSAAVARLPLALLGVAAIPIGAAIGRRLGGRWTAVGAAAIVALTPLTLLFSRVALSVSALPALLLATWWAWQRLDARGDRASAGLVGLALGAAVSFHPQAMALGIGLACSLAALRGLPRRLARWDLAVAAIVGFAMLGWVSWDVILDQIGLGPGIDYSGTWVDEAARLPFGTRLARAVPTTIDVLAGGRLLHWFAGPSSASPPGELAACAFVVVGVVATVVRLVRSRSRDAGALALAVLATWLLTVARSSDFDLSGLSRERYLLTTLVLACPLLVWGLVGEGRTRVDHLGAVCLVGLLALQGTGLGVGFFGAMARNGGDPEPSFVGTRPEVKALAAAWMLDRLGPDEQGLLLAGDSWSYWPVVALTGERFPADYVPEDPAACAAILRRTDHRRRWLMDFAGWHWNDEIRACLTLVGLDDAAPAFTGPAPDGRPLLLVWELPPGALHASP